MGRFLFQPYRKQRSNLNTRERTVRGAAHKGVGENPESCKHLPAGRRDTRWAVSVSGSDWAAAGSTEELELVLDIRRHDDDTCRLLPVTRYPLPAQPPSISTSAVLYVQQTSLVARNKHC